MTCKLVVLAYSQLPFVEARTVTELAKLAQKAEKAAMPEVFDTPTMFTVNSVAVQSAPKALPIARVYIRDTAAQYLAPYEYGGVQYLGKKPADLLPVGIAANRYGNLPRNTIHKYMSRPDVFMGTVRLGGRDIYGLWQTLHAGTGEGRKARTRHGSRERACEYERSSSPARGVSRARRNEKASALWGPRRVGRECELRPRVRRTTRARDSVVRSTMAFALRPRLITAQ